MVTKCYEPWTPLHTQLFDKSASTAVARPWIMSVTVYLPAFIASELHCLVVNTVGLSHQIEISGISHNRIILHVTTWSLLFLQGGIVIRRVCWLVHLDTHCNFSEVKSHFHEIGICAKFHC